MSDMDRDEPPSTLRVPPHSIEAEQSVIGGLLLDNGAWDRAGDILIEADFYRHEHRLIFAAVGALINANKPADVITVAERLTASGNGCGGMRYLNELASSVPSGAAVRRYAEIVRERAMSRALIAAGDAVSVLGFKVDEPVADRIEQASAALGALLNGTSTRDAVQLEAAMLTHTGVIEERASGKIRTIATGLPDMDDMNGGGFRPGNLVIIGARPSIGKTALALTIAMHMAQKHGVGILSMEMSVEELTDRATSLLGYVNLGHLQRPAGHQTDEFWRRVSDAVDSSTRLNCCIDDQGGLTLAKARAKARNMKRTNKIEVLIVDYLQLMQGRDDKVSRTYQLEEISRGLKTLAKELGIVIIALAQVNRKSEDRANAIPGLSDLKDCGAIEQDADVVAFLHRPIMLDPSLGEAWAHFAKMRIAKNRQGRTGDINLAYIGHETRFASWIGPEPVKADTKRKGYE